MAERIPIASEIPDEAALRLRRLDRLAWLLDRSIPLGKWRIGIDPILGLIPGAGDWLGAALSLYVLYQGARLGVPAGGLLRMAGNILVETVVGLVPVLGDLFDFAWQANSRNLAIVREHHHPAGKLRPRRWILAAIIVSSLTLLAALGYSAFLVIRWLVELLQ